MNSKLVSKFLLFFFICLNGYGLSDQSPLQTSSNLCAKSNYGDRCVQLGRKSYIIEAEEKKNWHEAERFCRRQKGYLVNIENKQEMDLILNYLNSKYYEGNDSRFYIGGNDLGSEGTYYSVGTGELMPYTRWLPKQPDNGFLRSENCVQLWKYKSSYAMNDENCTKPSHFICELRDFNY